MRTAIKAMHASVVVMAGVVLILLVIQPGRLLPASAFRAMRGATMTGWARWMTRALGVKREVDGTRVKGNALFVVNHVSWIDILVLMATGRGIFLAKSELADWPLIGWMCRQTDTLFLRRNSATALAEKIGAVASSLQANESIFLFPEGTTTNGRELRAFFPGLFQAAINAGRPVQPIALNYCEAGQPSPTVPFIGDDDFRDHLYRVLSGGRILARISILEPLDTEHCDRRHLARQSHARIARKLAA